MNFADTNWLEPLNLESPILASGKLGHVISHYRIRTLQPGLGRSILGVACPLHQPVEIMPLGRRDAKREVGAVGP